MRNVRFPCDKLIFLSKRSKTDNKTVKKNMVEFLKDRRKLCPILDNKAENIMMKIGRKIPFIGQVDFR